MSVVICIARVSLLALTCGIRHSNSLIVFQCSFRCCGRQNADPAVVLDSVNVFGDGFFPHLHSLRRFFCHADSENLIFKRS